MSAGRIARMLALAGLLAPAISCVEGRYSVLSPGGPAAHKLSSLGWPILLVFLFIVAVVWVLLLLVVLRRRGSLDEHAPVDAGGGERWVWIGGFLLPVLVFAAVFVATLTTLGQFPMAHHPGQPEIEVVGHQWWWEVHYTGGGPDRRVTTANELHIPVGRPVEIEVRTTDVIHSFWVPRLHGKVDLIPGHPNRVRIQADRPGTYTGECAEFCGLQHANMRMLVIAENPSDYQRWLARQRGPAAVPRTASSLSGQQIFQTHACALCHTVRGTAALGNIGPDLTHLASRQTLAANTLPNNVANLHAWVVNAPSLKPGVKMPALAQLNGNELHQLVDYLRSLQ